MATTENRRTIVAELRVDPSQLAKDMGQIKNLLKGIQSTSSATQQSLGNIGQGVSVGMGKVASSSRQMQVALQSVGNTAKQTQNFIAGTFGGGFSNQIRAATQSVGQLSGTMATLIGGLSFVGVGASFKEIATMADEVYRANKKLEMVSATTQEYISNQKALKEVMSETYLDIDTAATTFQRFRSAMVDNGKSAEQTQRVVRSLALATRVSAVAGSEQRSVLLQLSQAYAANRLGGDELRSVMENAPELARAMARSMSITTGELKNFGAQGRITADMISQGLLANEEKWAEQSTKMGVTFSEAGVKMSNAFKEAANAAVNITMLREAFNLLADGIVKFMPLLFTLGSAFAALTAAAGSVFILKQMFTLFATAAGYLKGFISTISIAGSLISSFLDGLTLAVVKLGFAFVALPGGQIAAILVGIGIAAVGAYYGIKKLVNSLDDSKSSVRDTADNLEKLQQYYDLLYATGQGRKIFIDFDFPITKLEEFGDVLEKRIEQPWKYAQKAINEALKASVSGTIEYFKTAETAAQRAINAIKEQKAFELKAQATREFKTKNVGINAVLNKPKLDEQIKKIEDDVGNMKVVFVDSDFTAALDLQARRTRAIFQSIEDRKKEILQDYETKDNIIIKPKVDSTEIDKIGRLVTDEFGKTYYIEPKLQLTEINNQISELESTLASLKLDQKITGVESPNLKIVLDQLDELLNKKKLIKNLSMKDSMVIDISKMRIVPKKVDISPVQKKILQMTEKVKEPITIYRPFYLKDTLDITGAKSGALRTLDEFGNDINDEIDQTFRDTSNKTSTALGAIVKPPSAAVQDRWRKNFNGPWNSFEDWVASKPGDIDGSLAQELDKLSLAKTQAALDDKKLLFQTSLQASIDISLPPVEYAVSPQAQKMVDRIQSASEEMAKKSGWSKDQIAEMKGGITAALALQMSGLQKARGNMSAYTRGMGTGRPIKEGPIGGEIGLQDAPGEAGTTNPANYKKVTDMVNAANASMKKQYEEMLKNPLQLLDAEGVKNFKARLADGGAAYQGFVDDAKKMQEGLNMPVPKPEQGQVLAPATQISRKMLGSTELDNMNDAVNLGVMNVEAYSEAWKKYEATFSDVIYAQDMYTASSAQNGTMTNKLATETDNLLQKMNAYNSAVESYKTANDKDKPKIGKDIKSLGADIAANATDEFYFSLPKEQKTMVKLWEESWVQNQKEFEKGITANPISTKDLYKKAFQADTGIVTALVPMPFEYNMKGAVSNLEKGTKEYRDRSQAAIQGLRHSYTRDFYAAQAEKEALTRKWRTGEMTGGEHAVRQGIMQKNEIPLRARQARLDAQETMTQSIHVGTRAILGLDEASKAYAETEVDLARQLADGTKNWIEYTQGLNGAAQKFLEFQRAYAARKLDSGDIQGYAREVAGLQTKLQSLSDNDYMIKITMESDATSVEEIFDEQKRAQKFLAARKNMRAGYVKYYAEQMAVLSEVAEQRKRVLGTGDELDTYYSKQKKAGAYGKVDQKSGMYTEVLKKDVEEKKKYDKELEKMSIPRKSPRRPLRYDDNIDKGPSRRDVVDVGRGVGKTLEESRKPASEIDKLKDRMVKAWSSKRIAEKAAFEKEDIQLKKQAEKGKMANVDMAKMKSDKDKIMKQEASKPKLPPPQKRLPDDAMAELDAINRGPTGYKEQEKQKKIFIKNMDQIKVPILDAPDDPLSPYTVKYQKEVADKKLFLKNMDQIKVPILDAPAISDATGKVTTEYKKQEDNKKIFIKNMEQIKVPILDAPKEGNISPKVKSEYSKIEASKKVFVNNMGQINVPIMDAPKEGATTTGKMVEIYSEAEGDKKIFVKNMDDIKVPILDAPKDISTVPLMLQDVYSKMEGDKKIFIKNMGDINVPILEAPGAKSPTRAIQSKKEEKKKITDMTELSFPELSPTVKNRMKKDLEKDGPIIKWKPKIETDIKKQNMEDQIQGASKMIADMLKKSKTTPQDIELALEFKYPKVKKEDLPPTLLEQAGFKMPLNVPVTPVEQGMRPQLGERDVKSPTTNLDDLKKAEEVIKEKAGKPAEVNKKLKVNLKVETNNVNKDVLKAVDAQKIQGDMLKFNKVDITDLFTFNAPKFVADVAKNLSFATVSAVGYDSKTLEKAKPANLEKQKDNRSQQQAAIRQDFEKNGMAMDTFKTKMIETSVASYETLDAWQKVGVGITAGMDAAYNATANVTTGLRDLVSTTFGDLKSSFVDMMENGVGKSMDDFAKKFIKNLASMALEVTVFKQITGGMRDIMTSVTAPKVEDVKGAVAPDGKDAGRNPASDAAALTAAAASLGGAAVTLGTAMTAGSIQIEVAAAALMAAAEMAMMAGVTGGPPAGGGPSVSKGGGGGSGGGAIASAMFPKLMAADGGITMGKTAATIGEAGPEALIPLERLGNMMQGMVNVGRAQASGGQQGRGGGGGGVSVFVNNTMSETADINVKTSEDAGGASQIEIIVTQKVSQMFQSGEMDGMMQGAYGINRQGRF